MKELLKGWLLGLGTTLVVIGSYHGLTAPRREQSAAAAASASPAPSGSTAELQAIYLRMASLEARLTNLHLPPATVSSVAGGAPVAVGSIDLLQLRYAMGELRRADVAQRDEEYIKARVAHALPTASAIERSVVVDAAKAWMGVLRETAELRDNELLNIRFEEQQKIYEGKVRAGLPSALAEVVIKDAPIPGITKHDPQQRPLEQEPR